MTVLSREQRALVESAMEEFEERARAMAKRLRGVTFDDLRGAMHAELVRAVVRYDPAKRVPFNGYAYRGVIGAMTDAASVERRESVWKIAAKFMRSEETAPTDEASALRIDPDEPSPHELAVGGIRARAAAIAARIAQEHAPAGEDEMIAAIDRRRLRAAVQAGLATLDERERKVLGLLHGEGKTLREAADELGVAQRTVQRIQDSARAKVGEAIRSAGLTVTPSGQ